MIRKALLIATAADLLGCGRVTVEPAADRSAVAAEVTELLERWAAAGEAGDWDALGEMYADEAGFAWIEKGEVRYRTHGDIITGLAAARDMGAEIRNEISAATVTPLSDDAAALYAQISVTVEAGGFEFASEGILAAVAVKRGGEWRFLQGAFSDRPPEATPE